MKKQRLKAEKMAETPKKFACTLFSSPADDTGVRKEFTIASTMYGDTLVMDDVLDGANSLLEAVYPEKYYPRAFVGEEYETLGPDGEWCPCVGDDENVEDVVRRTASGRVLVLPYARFFLSPWFRLYLMLNERGWLVGAPNGPSEDDFKELVEQAGLTTNTAHEP